MAITEDDYQLYAAASQPVNDTDAAGGAIDLTMRLDYTQFTAAARLALISDGADVRIADVVAYTAAGVRVEEAITLTGAVEVLSVGTFRHIMSVKLQTTSASRTVTVKQGAGGATIATIPVNEKGFTGLFDGARSIPGFESVRYAKGFIKFLNATDAATNAELSLVTETTDTLTIGVENALNGTQSVASRETQPPDVTFVDDNIEVGVIGGSMVLNDVQGFWIAQTLDASEPAFWGAWLLKFSAESS